VHRVVAPAGARTQLTFFPRPQSTAPLPARPRRGDHFVFSKDVGGGEFYQLYRYDLPSGRITLLTDGKSRNSLGPFIAPGMRLAYTSTTAQRQGHRPLRRSIRATPRAIAAGPGRGRRLAAARLVARRHAPAGAGVPSR
jgi:hypothetical protein